MPQVLKEILPGRGMREAGIQAVTEANNGGKIPAAGGDLEQGGSSHDNNGTSHQQKDEQHQGIQLQKALVKLCRAIKIEWIWNRYQDQDLARQFDEIAAKICAWQVMPHKTFISLVEEAQEKLREEKRASRLAAERTS